MTTKKYFWLKLPDNFFEDKSIKKLRKIAVGDTYTVIYLKMLLKSLKDNGLIYYDGIEDTVAEEIALELDEDPENVLVTINFLKRYGLLEVVDEDIKLTQLPSMVGCETDAARRKRSSRQKQMDVQICDNVTPMSHLCHTEIEKSKSKSKEIEVDIETESEKRERAEVETVSKDTVCSTDVERIMTAWNSLGINALRYIKPGTNRRAMLKAILEEYGMDSILEAIGNISRSSFLRGQNSRGWMITFDWFIKPNNFLKVLEGNYKDKVSSRQSDRNAWMDNIDYSSIEEGL